MNRILSLLLCITLPLASCTVLRDSRLHESLKIAARKTGLAVGSAVLQVAVSQLDTEKKGDFLQGLSGALWAQVPSVVNASTVEEIARQWTPSKSHWEALASELANDFADKRPQSPEEVREILDGYAEGLYLAGTNDNQP